MTPAQHVADRAWRQLVEEFIQDFALQVGIPLVMLRTGRYASRKVSDLRARCAFRLHNEIGLSLAQIAWALNASQRRIASAWVARGATLMRPPGVPDSRQLPLGLVG